MRLALCSWTLATGLRMASTTPQKAARRQATAAGTPAKRPKTSPHFRKGAFPPVVDEQTPPHTLLLGTQPSDTSLRENRYFMTNANVFWHIVGDALGFRRGFHVDGRTEACDFIRPHLLHDEELDYDDAVKKFTGAGYALWDTVASSQRKGSLDSAIQEAEYADVRGLLRTYPSIRRICFATGGGSAKIFAKAHAAWLKEPGAFRRRDDALSAAAFPKVPTTGEGVELCILLSASPASNPRETWSAAKQRQKGHSDQWAARPAALYPFKRRQWFDVCFADEPLVRAAAPFGASASDFRADEEGGDES